MDLPREIHAHYEIGNEQGRLLREDRNLEFLRTMRILSRRLPPPPAKIADIGGGAGIYAFPLAAQGYRIHLLDAVPLHIDQASADPRSETLAERVVGDARALPFGNQEFDAVLMLGPLYHLVERADRHLALREAMRVLKPGGLLFAAGISRYASVLDGFLNGHMGDPAFRALVDEDLRKGLHRNPTNHPNYFTTAKFHTAAELHEEVTEAGFESVDVLAVEGFGSFVETPEVERLLEYIEKTESEPEIIGISFHQIAFAQRPS